MATHPVIVEVRQICHEKNARFYLAIGSFCFWDEGPYATEISRN